MIQTSTYNHFIVTYEYIDRDYNELRHVSMNYHLKEGSHLSSLELIEKMVTPINNPQDN